jgi:hypothetical protein
VARTAVISIRTDAKLKDALEQAAYWDSRTLAGLVKKILTDWVVEQGYIKGRDRLRNPLSETLYLCCT